MANKTKAMLKYKDGYIISRRQMESLKDGLIWVEASSPGSKDGLDEVMRIFEEHEYEIVDWDDNIEILGA